NQGSFPHELRTICVIEQHVPVFDSTVGSVMNIFDRRKVNLSLSTNIHGPQMYYTIGVLVVPPTGKSRLRLNTDLTERCPRPAGGQFVFLHASSLFSSVSRSRASRSG